MPLDINAPFGVVKGICAEYPGAKFEQGGKLYNAKHEQIRANGAVVPVDTPPAPPKFDDQILELETKLLEAKRALEADPSPGRRSAVTKLENKIAVLNR